MHAGHLCLSVEASRMMMSTNEGQVTMLAWISRPTLDPILDLAQTEMPPTVSRLSKCRSDQPSDHSKSYLDALGSMEMVFHFDCKKNNTSS